MTLIPDPMDLWAENEGLKAENERLRNALLMVAFEATNGLVADGTPPSELRVKTIHLEMKEEDAQDHKHQM